MPKLQLSEIKLDKSIYPRKAVSDVNVARLVSALSAGVKLPPLVVDSDSRRLVDGWHRYTTYAKLKVEEVAVTLKSYASEADLFADAVRLNASHGEPLDHYSIQNAIIRLEQYGYQREQISQVVHLPVSRIEKIERGFAADEQGHPIAVKGGLSHLAGAALTQEQVSFNRGYGGTKALFYLKQLARMIEIDVWPRTDAFESEMDRLVELWAKAERQRSTAA